MAGIRAGERYSLARRLTKYVTGVTDTGPDRESEVPLKILHARARTHTHTHIRARTHTQTQEHTRSPSSRSKRAVFGPGAAISGERIVNYRYFSLPDDIPLVTTAACGYQRRAHRKLPLFLVT